MFLPRFKLLKLELSLSPRILKGRKNANCFDMLTANGAIISSSDLPISGIVA